MEVVLLKQPKTLPTASTNSQQAGFDENGAVGATHGAISCEHALWVTSYIIDLLAIRSAAEQAARIQA